MRIVVTVAATVAAWTILTAPAAATHGITKHDRQVVLFFERHPKLARTPAGGAALAAVLPDITRSLQAADAEPVWPPHHALWECIAAYEAPKVPVSAAHPDGLDWSYGAGTDDAHGGGMGFSVSWGYGLVGQAGDYSQFQQEWAAERGYAASGYSYSFLYGNWYEWDAAAGCGQ